MADDLTGEQRAAQSAIIAQMVGSGGLATAHLLQAAADIPPGVVLAAIDSLIEAGVLQREHDKIRPTAAFAKMDSLGMIGI